MNIHILQAKKIQIQAKKFGDIKKFVISTKNLQPKIKSNSRKLNLDSDDDFENISTQGKFLLNTFNPRNQRDR